MVKYPDITVKVAGADDWPLIAKVKKALAIGGVHPATIDLFTQDAMAVSYDLEKLLQTCSRWVVIA